MTGTWFTDYGARVQAYQGPWILLGGATIRQGSGITTSAGMDAAAVWHPPGRVSVEMSGGRYLRDPYQALPAGWYLSAGLRFTLWTPPAVTGGASVRQASLTTLTIGGQSTLAGSTTRSVPSVTKSTGGTGTGTGSANTGRGHRP
jgi:hypothetical protein